MFTPPRTLAVAAALIVAHLAASAAAQDPKQQDIHAKIAAAIEPWHHVEREWAEEATLIVVGRYAYGQYPKMFFDGGHFRPLRDLIQDVQPLKGAMKRTDFDLNLHGFQSGAKSARNPHDLVSGRKYLLYLRPSKASQDRLNDPRFKFTMESCVPASEIIAAVDISQSREEAEAFATAATNSAEHNGFTFTPERWAAFRSAEMVNLRLQGDYQRFIHEVVLRESVTLKEVRSYLGEPDYYHNNADGVYYQYHVNRAEQPRDGDVFLEAALYFDHDMTLSKFYLRHYKQVRREDDQYIVELDEQEYEAAGLTPIKGTFESMP